MSLSVKSLSLSRLHSQCPILQILEMFTRWFFFGESGTRLSGGNESEEGLQTIVLLHS